MTGHSQKLLGWADSAASHHPASGLKSEDNPPTLTMAQMRLLRIISGDSSIRPSGLADRMGCFPSNISRLLGQLERLNLIHRAIGRRDRSSVRLTLTPYGADFVQRQNTLAVSLLGEILASFDDKDLSFLESSLQQAKAEHAEHASVAARD